MSLICCLLPGSVMAEQLGAGGYLTQWFGGLVLVVAAIFALSWILRRMPGGTTGGNHLIEILAVRPIGVRERLLLVRVGDEQVLIGVTATGMTRLHRLRAPVAIEPTAAVSTLDFASLLKGHGLPNRRQPQHEDT